VNTLKELWEKLPPNRTEPSIRTPTQMARFYGNIFIPNTIQMFMLSCGVLIGSFIFLKIGDLSIIEIVTVLGSVLGVLFSGLFALSFTVRLGIDGRWENFMFSLIGVLGVITSFAFVYHATGLNISGNWSSVTFRDAWYFSAVTWTTLGYGDFSPVGDVRIFAVIEALLGYLFTAIIIGVFVTRLSRTLNEMTRMEKEVAQYPSIDNH